MILHAFTNKLKLEALRIHVEEKKVSITVSHVSLKSAKSSRTFDVEQILGPFKAMLRAEVDPEQLSENIRSMLQLTLQPRSLSLWLRTPITSSDPSIQTRWSEQLWQTKVTKQDSVGQVVQKPDANSRQEAVFLEINLAPTDPLVAYVLRHPGVLRVNRVHIDSPALRNLQAGGWSSLFH